MKIILKGDFFDCQIIYDRLFLWDTWGRLFVCDIRPLLKEQKFFRNDNESLKIDKGVLFHYCVAQIDIKGGIYPLDIAFMDGNLYTSTESGLYKRNIQMGKRFSEFSKGRVRKIIEIPFYEIAKGESFMALAGQKEGLFELYNKRRYRISKYGHAIKEIAEGIYSVNQSYSHTVWCDQKNIFSSDYNGHAFECHYRYGKRRDNSGRILRSYYKREVLPLSYEDQKLSLPYKSQSEERKAIGEKVEGDKIYDCPAIIEPCKVNKNTITEYPLGQYSFIVKGTNEPIPVASKPRRYFMTKYGIVVEAKKEVVIVKSNHKVLRIEGPVTRARKTAYLGKECLVIVLNDEVMIDDLKGEQQ